MPFSFGSIQLGWQRFLKPPLTDGKFKLTLPGCFAEADQPFFTFNRFRIWNTN